MRSENLISIVIPVFNDWVDLKELFNGLSLKNNSYSIEIIVVNDGSEDRSGYAFELFSDEIVLINHEKNLAGNHFEMIAKVEF